MSPLLRMPLSDPPLVPSPDDARARLREELVRPEYHDRNVLQQILDAVGRWFDDTVDAASGAPPLSTAAALLVAVLLLVGLGLLVSRVRSAPRAERAGAVLGDEAVSSAELRARARAAMAEERYEDAVVEGFRALTVGQVEQGRLDDRPGATAHEVAAALASDRPDLRERVIAGAGIFDQVRYGDRRATREQAAGVLALDDALEGVR
ncbi:DUF4129 domain-containing protein [Nocardioides lianchengensis]|uniref:Protein-glutamine gamma-glutamyltransferase-like C-terminal domain-containing protein n=1 Tax=Nocardioides lianchengensis TaxID=1045774 RepID=A0A1G6IAR4_9ACTN|nr:DUF4129 domain-containing protein [Nocardioides lianchengensis]NYG13107.1 hypothetical protein [Nocardioides lianchengensis]SDC03617.1 protein of unknown function [Nocardioides lianchengensis]